MSVTDPNVALEALKDSLQAALPDRYVSRNFLLDFAAYPKEQLTAGVIAVMSDGGGGFANYRGREGQLGTMTVALAGYVLVGENTERQAVELAELAMLNDLLTWVSNYAGTGLTIYPQRYKQSKQLEHPYGWLVLELEVKT